MKHAILISLLGLVSAVSLHAGTGMTMVCQDDAKTGKKSCGYEKMIVFGGGMFFRQLLGYCHECDDFVSITWTSEDLPPELAGQVKPQAKPEPLAKVWNPGTGKMHELHSCPKCTTPFLEIKTREELTHCPKCKKPAFAADPTKGVLAVD